MNQEKSTSQNRSQWKVSSNCTNLRSRDNFKSKTSSHISSRSRKSICINRKSTDGEYQKVTGFAAYMAQFVQNFFACCGGGTELNKTFRTSDASSNLLQYSFVAEPNSGGMPKAGEFNGSFAANPLDEENADFKSSFKSSVMDEDPDPDKDLREEYADFEREESEMPSVQRPIDTLTSNRFRAPGGRIDDCNVEAEGKASQLRLTVGTVDIASRQCDSADVLQFTQAGGSENYISSRPSCTRASMGGPSSQINSLNTKTESANRSSDHNDPRVWGVSADKHNKNVKNAGRDSRPYSTIQEEHDHIEINEGTDIVAEEIKLPKGKRNLKDMITQVPKSGKDYPQAQTKSTYECDQNTSSNHPSAMYAAGSTEEEPNHASIEGEDKEQLVDASDSG